MIRFRNFFFLIIIMSFGACQKDQPTPMLTSVSPDFGPAGTLVTFEGTHLSNIETVTFSDQEVNFNNAYNSDVALLFRIPTNIPLGEHEVAITTSGGTTVMNFRVTLDPPEIFRVQPEFASPGEEVAILGKNFFDPLEVLFFDSVQAQIVDLYPDSIVVIVPDGVEKGRIKVKANGGEALSPISFFSVNNILVNDFDGNGARPETNKWIFRGSINENGATAVVNTPNAISGNYMKLSGKDDLGISWIGGAQNNFGAMGDAFETFGIRTNAANTLLEMDLNNNGKKNTHLILILLEHNGSNNDFTHEIHVDWEDWDRISVPLNRFKDLNDIIIDPAKVKVLKIHLIDEEDSDQTLEVNVDNIRFVEIL